MNRIIIWEPRWSTKDVLVADGKLFTNNEVVITAKDAKGERYFPNPFYISGKRAKEFPLEEMPTKAGGKLAVRAIPLDELTKERIDV